MKKLLLILSFFSLWISQIGFANPVEVVGAGASFPAPLYTKWAENYQKTFETKINYQSIGSGGGIKQIIAKTVQFGASDKPMTQKELDDNELIQFPTVLGAVVPAYNIPGIAPEKPLKLSANVLSKIFLGDITKWNDPEIQTLNPDVKMPDLHINVIHRADGSGTTFIFTSYLSQVSAKWKEKVGADASVMWPQGIGGKGNEGIAVYLKQLPGAIGYLEYAYVKSNHLQYALLENAAGNFVPPEAENIMAAAENANWNEPFLILTNQAGEKTWPITGATFILMHKNVENRYLTQVKATLLFFKWCLENDKKSVEELHYVNLPDEVIQNILKQWSKEFINEQKQAIWNL